MVVLRCNNEGCKSILQMVYTFLASDAMKEILIVIIFKASQPRGQASYTLPSIIGKLP